MSMTSDEIVAIEAIVNANPALFRRGFVAWLIEHGDVWAAFKKYTLDLIAAGRTRYSSKTIIAVIRYEMDVATSPDEEGYMINDKWVPGMGRLFMKLYPAHDGFFPIRPNRKQVAA